MIIIITIIIIIIVIIIIMITFMIIIMIIIIMIIIMQFASKHDTQLQDWLIVCQRDEVNSHEESNWWSK